MHSSPTVTLSASSAVSWEAPRHLPLALLHLRASVEGGCSHSRKSVNDFSESNRFLQKAPMCHESLLMLMKQSGILMAND